MTRINDKIAVGLTLACGTMWMFYSFVLLSFVPFLAPSSQNIILFISNAIQLAFLPLLLVGQNILGRNAETRAEADHEAIMSELEEIKGIHETVSGLHCIKGLSV